MFCELGDVARKDCDKEKCGQESDLLPEALDENQTQAEHYLDNSRCHDHEIWLEWQPGWHLRQEFASARGQVTCAGEGKRNTQKDAGDVAKCVHLHKIAVSGRIDIQVPR